MCVCGQQFYDFIDQLFVFEGTRSPRGIGVGKGTLGSGDVKQDPPLTEGRKPLKLEKECTLPFLDVRFPTTTSDVEVKFFRGAY